jgi:hypothetical protein
LLQCTSSGSHTRPANPYNSRSVAFG